MKHQLIADSGSTKTRWMLTDGSQLLAETRTSGLNPSIMTDEKLRELLSSDLLPFLSTHLPEGAAALNSCYFYGAGCRSEAAVRMQRHLAEVTGQSTERIFVESDLLAAARALFDTQDGIACILGTGAACGLYQDGKLSLSISSLGYVLGDEGSGATLGRRILTDYLKGLLPPTLSAQFRDTYPEVSVDEVLRRVYREPAPNRYLASFAPFVVEHGTHVHIAGIITEEFRSFFRRNLWPYREMGYGVGFVGSIAYLLSDALRLAARKEGFEVMQILQEPSESLLRFHLTTLL